MTSPTDARTPTLPTNVGLSVTLTSTTEHAARKNNPESTRVAPYPFDNLYSDADVILQAADGTRFYLHKSTLRVASDFFAEMFSLPQPPLAQPSGSSASPTRLELLAIVPVTESSATLERLLRLCYPVKVPEEHDTHGLAAVLGAALKYEMPVTTALLTTALASHVAQNPLYVFSVAYKCALESVARAAVRSFVTWRRVTNLQRIFGLLSAAYERAHQLDEYSSEMDDLPAAVYFRLLEYYASRTEPSRDSVEPADDVDAFWLSRKIGEQPRNEAEKLGRLTHPFQDSIGADTIVWSSDHAVFHLRSSFLAFASPVLAGMLSPSSGTPSPSGLPQTEEGSMMSHVHRLPEDGRTLSTLFQLVYPMPDPALAPYRPGRDEELKSALALWEAATKYEVPRAIAFAKQACVGAAKHEPVRLYLIASRYKWDDVARDAATRAVYETLDAYLPEMDDASASAYRRLLVYRQKCRDIILSGGQPTPPGLISAILQPQPGTGPAHAAPRYMRAPYWSKSSWLSRPVEARFWRTLHEFVNKNRWDLNGFGREGFVFNGDIEEVLPRSVVDDKSRASRGGSADHHASSPAPAAAGAQSPEGSIAQELERIAQALAKVRGHILCSCTLKTT